MGEVTCKQCLHEWACVERDRGIICKDFYPVPRKEEQDNERGQNQMHHKAAR